MSVFDFDEGYDFTDPKHSMYAERMFEQIDYLLKRDKENPPVAAEDDECDCDGCA